MRSNQDKYLKENERSEEIIGVVAMCKRSAFVWFLRNDLSKLITQNGQVCFCYVEEVEYFVKWKWVTKKRAEQEKGGDDKNEMKNFHKSNQSCAEQTNWYNYGD